MASQSLPIRGVFEEAISIPMLTLACCLNVLNTVSSAFLNHHSYRRTYDCRNVPGRCGGCAPLCHCGGAFWDGFIDGGR